MNNLTREEIEVATLSLPMGCFFFAVTGALYYVGLFAMGGYAVVTGLIIVIMGSILLLGGIIGGVNARRLGKQEEMLLKRSGASACVLGASVGIVASIIMVINSYVLLDMVTSLNYPFTEFASLDYSMLVIGTVIILFVGFPLGMTGSFGTLTREDDEEKPSIPTKKS